jgi:hypothetical protein
MNYDFLTLREASRALNEQGHPVTYWQLWDRAERGVIPVHVIAGRRLLRRDDLPQVAEAFASTRQ